MGVGVAEEVEHDELALVHLREHVVLGATPLPELYDPLGLAVGLEHGFADALVGRCHVDATGVGALVEGVHAVVGRCAHHLSEARVIFLGNVGERLCVGVEDVWPHKTTPVALVVGRIALLGNVAWHHTGVARQHGLHAQFALAGQDLLGQRLLSLIPPVGVLAAPSLEVVHAPPRLEAGPGNKLVGLVVGISQVLCEELLPHHIETHDLQGHVDAVERHPVDFLLPALPRPGRHGIREGAIVEIVAVARGRGVFLLLGGHGQLHLCEVGGEVVPCEVDMGVMVQVPIDAGCEGRQVGSLDTRFSVFRGHHECLAYRRAHGGVYDGYDAFGCALSADTVQEVANPLWVLHDLRCRLRVGHANDEQERDN